MDFEGTASTRIACPSPRCSREGPVSPLGVPVQEGQLGTSVPIGMALASLRHLFQA